LIGPADRHTELSFETGSRKLTVPAKTIGLIERLLKADFAHFSRVANTAAFIIVAVVVRQT
jgi:hypothetical protein